MFSLPFPPQFKFSMKSGSYFPLLLPSPQLTSHSSLAVSSFWAKLVFLFSLKLKPHAGGEEKGLGQPTLENPFPMASYGAVPPPATTVPPAHPGRLWCEFPCPVWVSCPQRCSRGSLSPSEADPSKLERLVCLVAGFLLGVLWLFFFFFTRLIG